MSSSEKKGWLSVNAFVNTRKFYEIYTMLLKAAKGRNILLEKKTNAQLLEEISDFSEKECDKPDFIIFWDKDIHLADMLEKKGLKLFNSSEAIRCCDDKILTYTRLFGTDIKMPKTYIAPKTFLEKGFLDYDFLPKNFEYPVIIKEAFGSFGKQVFMAESYDEIINVVKEFNNRPFIIQEFIKNSMGRDVRINVVGGNVVAAMMRYNDNDFRANITNGGSMKRYNPTSEEEEMAVKAARYLGLDFGGIDILFGENGPIFCEANSNAHFKNIYDCTGVNVAEYIIKHIDEKVYL